MKTVLCNNHLCGKEYSVKFDNCPFCGTPNPISESERNNMIANDNEDVTENVVEDKQFNGIVIGLIWISIFFFGIRGIISSFTNMIYSPGIGCLTLILSIIGIVSLCFILRAKKWALFMWIAYRLAAGIVNGFISSKFDFATNIIIAIANIGLMVLVLQIKKNGVSAWSIIFKKHESRRNEENIKSTLKDGAVGGNTFSTSLVDNNNETPNTNNVHNTVQDNDNTVDLEETQTIKCIEDNQVRVIPTTETEFRIKLIDNQDKAVENPSHDKEETKQEQGGNNNPNKWAYWSIIGLLITILAAGIWFLAKTNNDNSMTEQIDSLSMGVFDCGLFSFEYPKSFKTTPIQNAPHMVLKLESEDYFMSASYWDYGISDDVSIWDDELYEHYRQMPIEDGEIVDISKESIKTKGGLRHCLRIMSNGHKIINSSIVQVKMLSYLMIQNGYLFNFTFESEGEYIKGSSTTYPDNIMCGLYLKTNKEESYPEAFNNKESIQNSTIHQNVHSEIVSIVQRNNEDLPEYLGFGMTMMRCVLENRSIVYVIQWKGMNPSDFTSEDIAELKDALVEGLMEEKQESAVSKAMLNTMKKNDYNFVYRYINESGQRLCSISISPSEI